jgi:hypothetical protein
MREEEHEGRTPRDKYEKRSSWKERPETDVRGGSERKN